MCYVFRKMPYTQMKTNGVKPKSRLEILNLWGWGSFFETSKFMEKRHP